MSAWHAIIEQGLDRLRQYDSRADPSGADQGMWRDGWLNFSVF